MTTAAFIYDAVRTPRGKGKQDGALNEVKPVKLLAGVLAALQSRNRLDTALVEDVISGCVSAAGEQGADIGKTAALLAGWPDSVPGMQLDRFCASGLEAVNIAAAKIMSGMESLIVAAGVESMSRVPIGAGGGAFFTDSEFMTKTGFVSQGISADLIAAVDGYDRETVDAFALTSQQKAASAQKAGLFNRSLVPVQDEFGDVLLDYDEHMKPATTMAGLAALKPSFSAMGKMGMDQVAIAKYPTLQGIGHVHTAGNSSGVVDGASAVLIGSEAIGRALSLAPRARIVAMAVVSTEPTIMLTGPVPATRKVLAKAGLRIEDIDLFEVNEAFAAVALRFINELHIPVEKVNVNGGAIAMGHPLGATGGMLVATLIDELDRRSLRRGICTFCVGGGMGVATLIERVYKNPGDNLMRDAIFEKNSRNIVTVSINMQGRKLNVMNDDYVAMLDEVLGKLAAERADIAGVIITSAKDSFVAGGDVHKILGLRAAGPKAAKAFLDHLKNQLRRLETLGVPVVAALNGTALGGGLELALACHHRIALDNPKARFGFPEVGLGILPGAGGVARSVRLLGLMKALLLLTEGRQLNPAEARKEGLIDDLADGSEAMLAQAEAWILANPKAAQPWDRKGFALPGGDMFAGTNAGVISMFPSMIYKKTRGLLPAAERILAAAVEGAQCGFDSALAIEGRKFIELLMSPVAENLIRTMFLQTNEISSGASRPRGIPKRRVTKLGVLGAGMMGRGIAYAAAIAGIEVMLKDISIAAAEKAKAYTANLLSKRVERGAMSTAQSDAVLALIHPTIAMQDLSGCDLIIEAVFEDVALKRGITAEVEAVLAPDAMVGTNTSTLPITLLAEGSSRPENFIGLHFFSPVDKMHVVEIIRGRQSSDECLARAYDFVQQIKKTPIIVSDARGFFTSRVFSMYPDEGDRLLQEGVDPVLIENLAWQTGMPVGPLAVQDEVMMDMMLRAQNTNKQLDADLGGAYASTFGVCGELCAIMCEHNRPGRAAGHGFYDYVPDGTKALWPGLYRLFGGKLDLPHRDIKDRMIFRMVVEALRCLEEGVVVNLRDGNVGSILAFGFPVYTGGIYQFVESYGIDAFNARCKELAAAYGERFTPPEGAFSRLRTLGIRPVEAAL